MTGRRLAGLVAVGMIAAGCGGEPTAPAPVAAGALDPSRMAPDCASAVPKTVKPGVAGLIGPAPVAVGSTDRRGPGFLVTGYVDMAPDVFVNEAVTRGGWTVVHRESEGVDSEIMISDGTNRVLWSLRIVCPTGSSFQALVAKEDAEGRRFIVAPKKRL